MGKGKVSGNEAVKNIGSTLPVNLFGCLKCRVAVFEFAEREKTMCPVCHATLDLYVSYRYLAFAEGIQIRNPQIVSGNL